jgi:hypothetical protein
VRSLLLFLMTPAPAAIAVDNVTILVLITVIVAPIAAIAFACSGAAWKGLGKGRLGLERELPPPRAAQSEPAPDEAFRAAEVRQMLEARSYRRQQRGEAPIDVEAEAARVLNAATAAPGIDEELWAEVRLLVVARNERRLCRGQAPLNVEVETRRQLTDFIGSD